MPTVGLFNNQAETHNVTLELLDRPDPKATWGNPGKPISGWTSFTCTSDFLAANDSWDLELVAEVLPQGNQLEGDMARIQKELQNGQRVGIRVNGTLVCTGYVDQIVLSSSRNGSSMRVRGRDALSLACDTYVEPHFKFPEGSSLKAFLLKLFSPFGFKDIVFGDKVNRQKLTGNRSAFIINEYDKVVEKQLATPINSKYKPHNNEGIYEYAERIGRRMGFHIWCGVDGQTLYIGTPDFKQPPVGRLIHRLGAGGSENNILSQSGTYDWSKQPVAIIASGHGGGGKFNMQTIKTIMVNELLTDSDGLPVIKELKDKYKNAIVIPRRSYLQRPARVVEVTKFGKVHYAVDDESKEQKHLDNYVRRLMAEFQSRFLVMQYTVSGFGQNGNLWAPNTMVTVVDEYSGINQDLWIKARTFSKDRNGGTTTQLTCILPFTLELQNEDA